MKAIRVHEAGGPEVLRLEEIPQPTPSAGEIVVRLEHVGINFIEIYQRKGMYPQKLPYVPGREGAGVVTAVGSGVTTVKVGDRVASEQFVGAYAELSTAKADNVVRMPDGVDSAIGAAVMLQGMTAHYLAVSTYPLKKGDRCLIHAAAGGVGLLLCQIAKRRGAWIVGTTSTPEKAQLARDAGADEVILYTEQDFVAEVRRLTSGAKLHVVYDSVGKTTFDASLDCLMPRGMMVLFGQSSGAVPPFDPQILNRKGSLFFSRPNLANYVATPEELTMRASDLFEWIREGWLKVHIDRTVPLAEAAEAHRALESRATVGKVLLAT
ncbi:MAG TPA: quinone oxidoreductase [Gemmatimonadaceae bacterium]|nr:quinone oxidoreductase [Gemmatimonadaceae bacterium]